MKKLSKYKEAIACFFVITMVLGAFIMVLCLGDLFPQQYRYDIFLTGFTVLAVSTIFAIASTFIREKE